jgi:hypothetical protein
MKTEKSHKKFDWMDDEDELSKILIFKMKEPKFINY